MMVPSWLCPIYFLDVVPLDGRGKSSSMPARTCKGHILDKSDRYILLPGHFHEVGDFSIVEVLDDDNIQFDRLKIRR